MKESLGLDFVERTLRTTGVLLLIFLLPGIYYMGAYPALAVFSGGVWGMVNIIFLSSLMRAAICPGKIEKARVAGLALVKFPLLYAAGYFLLKVDQFEPLYLLIGFSILLVVMVLKVIARALLGLDEERHNSAQLPGAV